MASSSPSEVPPETSEKNDDASAAALKVEPSSHTSVDLESLPTLTTLRIASEAKTEENEPLSSAIRWKRHIQFASLCWCFVLEGWNDGSTGPLLPRIQSTYHVNFAVVSLLFVFLCMGFICGAVLNVYLTDRYGFGKIIVAGTFVQLISYAIEISAPPFPVWVFAFTLYGFGTALQSSQVNGFVAGLNDPSRMSVLHSCYGFGALSSPFVATRFSVMKHWSYHYFTAAGIALSAVMLLIVVFRFKTQDEVLAEIGFSPKLTTEDPLTIGQSKYKKIWGLKVVHLLAFFIFAYCGVECTIGGWAVTYIIHRTGGGPTSGYVSSGFFGGLTAGRLLLIKINKMIGERRSIFIYSAICIALEIFIWAYPSLIPTAIAISFVGFFLGPMFPIVMNQCSNFIPHGLLIGSIGWIVSFGLLGTAVVPFMTGALSENFGVVSLQPLLLVMIVFMVAMWTIVMLYYKKGVFSQQTTPALSRTETEISK